MSGTKGLVLVVTRDVLLNVMEDKEDHRPRDGLYTLPTFPGILHASSTIPAFDDTEGALGGTSYHPCVADLRHMENRPQLALS